MKDTETLIILLYLAPLALALRTWRLWSDNAPKLPDRIPTHFNLAGKPDGWMAKRPFGVILMPLFSTGLAALMFFSLCILPIQKGIFEVEMAASGLALCLALTWFFHQSSAGMIDVALGKADNLWPYMKMPLVIVILVSVALPVPALLPHTPSLDRAVLAGDMNPRNYTPIRPATQFSKNDPEIYLILNWKNLDGKHTVRMRWLKPGGNLFYEYRYSTPNAKRHPRWHVWSRIQTEDAPTGRWTVVTDLDGKTVSKISFELAPVPSPTRP